MFLKSFVIAAALLAPVAAQAQESEWYLTGSSGDIALFFVDRTSVRMTGDQASATVVAVSVNAPQIGDQVIRTRMEFNCVQPAWRALGAQSLDLDGQPIGTEQTRTTEWKPIAPDTFFSGAQKFACGGSANPDPKLLIGSRPPVRVAHQYLVDRQSGAATDK